MKTGLQILKVAFFIFYDKSVKGVERHKLFISLPCCNTNEGAIFDNLVLIEWDIHVKDPLCILVTYHFLPTLLIYFKRQGGIDTKGV